MNEEIKNKLIELLIKNINPSLTSEDIEFCEDLEVVGLDSLNFVKIIVELEEEFDVEFDPLATIDEFNVLDKFINYIKENI